MFGRQITMKLKANSAKELTRINENEIIPMLRKHKGFRDETTFIAPERSEAVRAPMPYATLPRTTSGQARISCRRSTLGLRAETTSD